MRCRGPAAPSLHCGAMRCRGPEVALHERSLCQQDPRCEEYYTRTFANHTFCIAVGSRRVERTPLQPATAAICMWSEVEVLARCRAPTGVAVSEERAQHYAVRST